MTKEEKDFIRNVFLDSFTTQNVLGDHVTLADALLTAADFRAVVRALERLGLNDAATSMGALELHAKEILDGSTRIADALRDIADAIRG